MRPESSACINSSEMKSQSLDMSEELVSVVSDDDDFMNNLEENHLEENEDESDRIMFDDKIANVISKQMPPNASDPQNVDSLIAFQMAKLSVADREKAYMDVHGIPDLVEESPELIQKSLSELEHEIDMLPDKKAYSIAERLDPEYVRDRDFCLAFLRCEKFDCQKAALRIIRHFQTKLDLFGEDKLAMDITQDDLDMDDMDAVYSGAGRFLNAYDSGGRIINFLVGVPKVYKTDAVCDIFGSTTYFQLRRAFYNIMVAFRDNAEVQRRGAVAIGWTVGNVNGTAGDNADMNWKLPRLHEGTPMRASAVHLCYTDDTWKDSMAVMRSGLNKQIQVRVRVHHGTIQECMQHLRRHGINPTSIPVNENGEISDQLEYCRRLEQLRKHERLKYPLRHIIGVPSAQDVLLGKGTPFQNHAGNKSLRQVVSDRYKEYEKAQKGLKKVIAKEIVDAIRGNGGLFLKQDGKKWIPVNGEVAVLKVSAAFRTLRLKGGTK
ncbi:unnamed protein product [Cylindrotheca closterium]|uniref:DUF6824 domain-containing protein n=1 Tax=Cylindrotheca closterium TaxID=2856 RepID=A0AAD2G802_9STRA|nr:unnamed protein product [Cylindrotheca closterium]